MDDMNVRANEVEEIETGTEIEEVEGRSEERRVGKECG